MRSNMKKNLPQVALHNLVHTGNPMLSAKAEVVSQL
jgi:hypothetical protein